MSVALGKSVRAPAARGLAVRVQAVAKPSTSSTVVKKDEAQMQTRSNIWGYASVQRMLLSEAAKAFKAAALAAVSADMLMCGHAQAAQEVAAVAGDNRVGILLTLFAPVVGWVLFNIAGPAFDQLKNVKDQNKGVLVGAGLGLSALLFAGQADAAQEIAAVAGDNRVGILLTLFAPVVGWVGLNILGPALQQLNSVKEQNQATMVGAGLGLSALLFAGQADAAQEIAAVAGDNRVGILLTLFAPVVGWVGLNILGPALQQLNSVKEQNQ